jgi:hypothetical protein
VKIADVLIRIATYLHKVMAHPDCYNNSMRTWRMERHSTLGKIVVARKDEKARIKQIKGITRQRSHTYTEFWIVIEDYEMFWKPNELTWKNEEEQTNCNDRTLNSFKA